MDFRRLPFHDGRKRFDLLLLSINIRLLFLVFAMFFEKLIEQHRVHSFVANRIWFSFFIGQYQGRIHLCDFFGDQAKTGENSRNVALHYFRHQDPGAFVSISGGGILASSKHPAQAQAFLKWITGKAGQEILKTGSSYEYAVGVGAQSNPKLVPLAELEAPVVEPSRLNSKKVTELMLEVAQCFFRIRALGQKTGFITGWGGDAFGFIRSLALLGPLTVPQIAQMRPTSRQRMQRLADELAAEGLVEFIDNPKHRRSKLVRLTERSRRPPSTKLRTSLSRLDGRTNSGLSR